ncbi:DUF4349 domain-containing protein [Ectopseudomonas alcaliphila]|uniref:DUF4349 domain-containing protein n=1 Tax=Ectopseudomonas alcaliphila TaxID=101564 RepID=A0A1G6V364_9GAMM|nr:DUF4349 domain-containing protein [Pseudomonas alcaliphila]MDX5991686.1 DUF4349 domain-containing protein [Pseudomonas alcaliphila]SDD47931.1 protein of unknown function [Pseudomonas alcaliphila]
MKPWMVVALLAVLAGCSEQSGAPLGGALQGERNTAGNYLAYEHHVGIELPAEQIGERIAATREACLAERFGTCSLIAAQQSSGRAPHGELTLRIVPDGVEAITALASEGGELTRRTTRAEDLAQAVSDNRRQHEQLLRQQQTLQQFEKRDDLAVADLLALAREQAALEVQLQALAQEAAQQQRRLDTNLLTLNFSSPYESSPLGRIGDAFSRLTYNLAEGTANLIEFIGYSLPFLIVLFPLALGLRKLWRRLASR